MTPCLLQRRGERPFVHFISSENCLLRALGISGIKLHINFYHYLTEAFLHVPLCFLMWHWFSAWKSCAKWFWWLGLSLLRLIWLQNSWPSLSINFWYSSLQVLVVAVLAILPLIPANLSNRAFRLAFAGTACSSLYSLYSLYGVNSECRFALLLCWG